MSTFVYAGDKTKEISFPLGGIGTGCIGLAGNGRLIDWEIFNRPNKGSVNGFSHFAIKAQQAGEVLDARILNGDLQPPYSGQGTGRYASFGFGPPREFLAGLPHFGNVVFRGEFPIAVLDFKERKFPGQVRMTAFNPFIPLNDKDSGIPGAFFEFQITNPTRKTITYTLAGTLGNPLPQNNKNSLLKTGKTTLLHLTSNAYKPNEPDYGDLTIATDAANVSCQQYWFRGGWRDNLEVYWRDFTSPGKLPNRTYGPAKTGRDNNATLAADFRLLPGRSKTVRFVITWNFPNCRRYWPMDPSIALAERKVEPVWKNYYARLWKNSRASASYALKHWARLRDETLLFKETLFASDLPPAAIDAVSANISILKSPTVMRLEDGTFYGFEGCHPSEGCCEGSCTHVWNYAQALPFLFPALERSMRQTDYQYNLQGDGGMPFRLQLPLGIGQSGFRPCADGQLGGLMKLYRDWKISGDTAWLKKLWPAAKKSLEFTWAKTNPDQWDPDKSGVLTGRQHHTLDMELFGPNSWLSGFYLGALKAAAEMADQLGEPDAASEYRAIFKKGKQWVDKHLFNGEYYHQLIDISDKSIAQRFGATDSYWSSEHKQMKYQIADGCNIDQVLAQWHANLYGLGEIFDPTQTKKALKSIFKYNFKKSMRDFYNPWRVFCLNDEAGLVICDWPEGKEKPMIPLTYAQETMHGFEYAAAILMIQSGLIDQGVKVVKAVRDRYDGEKRNPWNEIECGSNYARSMASYALLNAFAGFEFDMANSLIGFNPLQTKNGRFRCFWSLDSGWGEFRMTPARIDLHLLYGRLPLKTIKLPATSRKTVANVRLDGESIPFQQHQRSLHLQRKRTLYKGQTLHIILT